MSESSTEKPVTTEYSSYPRSLDRKNVCTCICILSCTPLLLPPGRPLAGKITSFSAHLSEGKAASGSRERRLFQSRAHPVRYALRWGKYFPISAQHSNSELYGRTSANLVLLHGCCVGVQRRASSSSFQLLKERLHHRGKTAHARVDIMLRRTYIRTYAKLVRTPTRITYQRTSPHRDRVITTGERRGSRAQSPRAGRRKKRSSLGLGQTERANR